MTTWMLNRVCEYWDQKVGAIFTHAQRLEKLAARERQSALAEIGAAVARHAAALDDEWLAQAAFVMVDDLYKAACALTYWDQSIAEYLEASAGTFCVCLTDRGYVLRFVIDNAYEPTEVGLAGPVKWFPIWFGAAGFRYICPQQLAFRVMEQQGQVPDAALLPLCIADGRAIGDEVIRRCHDGRNHYIFLDTDATDQSLAAAVADHTTSGVIFVLRKEAPVAGSRCVVQITPPSVSGRA